MSCFHGFSPAPLPLPMQKNCAPVSASSASSASSHSLKSNEKTGLVGQIGELPRYENMQKRRKPEKQRKHPPWFGSFPCTFSEGHSRLDECVDSQAKQ